MTRDEAQDVIWDFLTAVADADNFPMKRSYQQDKEEFRQQMIAALQFAPVTIFATCDGDGTAALSRPHGETP